jgi:hypothetical protein
MKNFFFICVYAFAPYNISAYGSDFPLSEMNLISGAGTPRVINKIELSWRTDGFPNFEAMNFGTLVSADIGRTISLSSSTTAGFDFFRSLLTNGNDDNLKVYTEYEDGSGGGISWPESGWFQHKFVNSSYPDFHGYDITRIELTINNLVFLSPGSNRNGDGIWTDLSWDYTFTVYGVPEPATLLLFGLGVVIAVRKRRI